jgi:cytochrome c peroxidase
MRRTRSTLFSVGAIVLTAGLLVCRGVSAKGDDQPKPKTLVPLPEAVPAPKDNPTTPEKVALGKQLFFDPRLSGDNQMSCATCHLPEKAFGDGLARGKGHDGRTLGRNTPSLLNVGFYERFD